MISFLFFRLNPYFRTQSKQTIKSCTFSNNINPKRIMCKFDLLGSCNDEKCRYWHYEDACSSKIEDLIKNLVSYDPTFYDATDDMSIETKKKLLHSFTQQFVAQYSGKISSEEHLLILWNKMKEKRKENKKPVYECVEFLPTKNLFENNDKDLNQITENDSGNSPIQFKSQIENTLYKVKTKLGKKSKENETSERYIITSKLLKYVQQ